MHTPIPKGLDPGTSVHPAMQNPCIFYILGCALVEYSQLPEGTESHLVMLDLLKDITDGTIISLEQVRDRVAHQSIKGLFQPFNKPALGTALVFSICRKRAVFFSHSRT